MDALTATDLIAALPLEVPGRECVLVQTAEGYRLMILLEDQMMAVDFTGAPAKTLNRAWDILTGAVWRQVGQLLQ